MIQVNPSALNERDLDSVSGDAALWHVRREDGLTVQEEAQFQQWLARAPEHREAFAQMAAAWAQLESLPAASVASLRANDQSAVPSSLARLQGASTRAGKSFPALLASWWGALRLNSPMPVMALLVVCVLGLCWTYWWRLPVFSETFVTARGEQRDIELPDGSRLVLDTDTQAQVTLYRQRREVRLPHGQVMFVVKSDQGKPFDVLSGAMRVSVVGTRFSVRHTVSGLAETGIHVEVEEGRVRVARDGAESGVLLTAGQAVDANASGELGAIATLPAGAVAQWRQRRVSFTNTSLSQALAEFERYNPTRLVILDPNVAAMRINGSFDLWETNAFARALPQVLPVHLLKKGEITEIAAGR